MVEEVNQSIPNLVRNVTVQKIICILEFLKRKQAIAHKEYFFLRCYQ